MYGSILVLVNIHVHTGHYFHVYWVSIVSVIRDINLRTSENITRLTNEMTDRNTSTVQYSITILILCMTVLEAENTGAAF